MGYRYIGSKTRVLDRVVPAIQELASPGATVADLMCGTSAVSSALRHRGYRVIANDLLTFCYHHARVSLLFASPPTFKGIDGFISDHLADCEDELFPMTRYERLLRAIEASEPRKGYFWREFCSDGMPTGTDRPRNYFSPENAKKIDGMRATIRNLGRAGSITDLERSLLLHDLIMGANDVANIAGTYGHYMAKLTGRACDQIRLTPTQLQIGEDAEQHVVMQGYAEDVAARITCDVCYIDPPYMKRQYAANYHILETLAREDEPEAIGASGLRPWRDQYSNFCTKTRIQDSFRRIFSEMNCDQFLISYSEDGLLPITELEKLFSEFGPVKTQTFTHKRFRSNKSSLKKLITEYLIALQKR